MPALRGVGTQLAHCRYVSRVGKHGQTLNADNLSSLFPLGGYQIFDDPTVRAIRLPDVDRRVGYRLSLDKRQRRAPFAQDNAVAGVETGVQRSGVCALCRFESNVAPELQNSAILGGPTRRVARLSFGSTDQRPMRLIHL